MIKLKEINNNENDNPSNGDMNEEDANLLKEEIDNLEKTDNKKTLNLSFKNEDDEGKWTLLDIKFGLPLFDSELNKALFDRIIINR